jgi:GntR family transcriptional regulator
LHIVQINVLLVGQYSKIYQCSKDRPVNSTKYHRIYLLLKDAIARGDFAPGECLPGELTLSDQHQVSRITVRRALAALANESLVVRRVGVGTVVAPPKTDVARITADVSNLLPNFVRMSNGSSIRLLEFAYRPVSEAIAAKLKLGSRDQVQYSVRVRSMNGKPFSYLITHVPATIAQTYNESELANTSLFVLLERGGVKVDHATQTISATLATQQMADALDVPVGAPLIALQRVVFDRDGRGVEHLDAFYRPDRYQIQVDLGRVGQAPSRYWQPLVGDVQVKEKRKVKRKNH